MAEQATNPTRESPRTDWDIGKAMSGHLPGAPDDEQELEAEGAPDEGTVLEDEGVDDEASGGEDADPDEDEGTSDEEAFSPLSLKVSGKDHIVNSREEAIELAQKGMHYTQEMQKLRDREAQLASERETERTGLRQQVDQYSTALKQLSDVYGHVLGSEAPDWNSAEMQKLKAEKPTEYLAMREQYDQLGAIRGELSRIEQEKQAEAKKQWESWVANEQTALAEKRPEWTDAAKRQQDWSLIQEYATSAGLSEQEIGNLYDHRFWLILHDAARYRQATATGRKAKPAVTRTAEPGTGRNVNQGQRTARAQREALRQTGDVRAAGDILQGIMTRKK